MAQLYFDDTDDLAPQQPQAPEQSTPRLFLEEESAEPAREIAPPAQPQMPQLQVEGPRLLVEEEADRTIWDSIRENFHPLLPGGKRPWAPLIGARDSAEKAFVEGITSMAGSLIGGIGLARGMVRKELREFERGAAEALGFEPREKIDPEQEPLYRAGRAVAEAGRMTEEERREAEARLGYGVPLISGLSQAAGYIGMGLVNPVLPLAAGSASASYEFYEDARESGATPEDKERAARLGAAFGLSEAAPIELALMSMKRLPGVGPLMKVLDEVSPTLAKGVGIGAKTATVAATEGGQEAFMQVMQNLTARDFVGYDPERDPFENAGEMFAVGAGVGGIMGFVLSSLGGRRGVRQRLADETPEGTPRPRRTEEEVEELLTPERFSQQTDAMAEDVQGAPTLTPGHLKKKAQQADGATARVFEHVAENMPDEGMSRAAVTAAVQSTAMPLTQRREMGEIAPDLSVEGRHVYFSPMANRFAPSERYPGERDYFADTKVRFRDGALEVQEIQSDLFNPMPELAMPDSLEPGAGGQVPVAREGAIEAQQAGEEVESRQAGTTTISTRVPKTSGDHWKRMIAREEIKRAAAAGIERVRFPQAGQKIPGAQANGKKFDDWLQKEYDTRLVTDADGHTWIEVRPPEDMALPIVQDGLGSAEHVKALMDDFRKVFREGGVPLPPGLRNDLDVWNKGVGLGLTLHQMARENGHIQGVQDYHRAVQNYTNTKNSWIARAEERIVQWHKLGFRQGQALSNALLRATGMSDSLGRRLTDDELTQIFQQLKLNQKAIETFFQIDRDFQAVVTNMERLMQEEIDRIFRSNPEQGQEARRELQERIDRLRNRNYFPYVRFGEYFIEVRNRRGEVVEFLTAESKRKADRVRREVEKRLGKGEKISQGKMTENTELRGAAPRALAQALENVLSLSPEQKVIMQDLLIKMAPARSFIRHMQKRKGTAGFTADSKRAYADYFMRFGGHIARLEHKQELLNAIDGVKASSRRIRDSGRDSTSRDEIASWLDRHYDYLMNPKNEWAGIRAAGFVFYLGFMAKSAYVNLTQPFLVAYPYLAARYGDAEAIGELTRGYADITRKGVDKVLAKSMRDVSQSLVKPHLIEPELDAAIRKGISDGFIKESLASEVAATATGALETLPGTHLGHWIRNAQKASAWLFQSAEEINRRVTFMAAFRLARRKIANGRKWDSLAEWEQEQIYNEAREAIDSTMYEYARWNRPAFMRGRASVVFLFYSYVQNTMYFATRDPGAGRFWLMMLMVAGVQGLPMAEDLLDLLDTLFAQFPELRNRLGMKERGLTDLRTEMREGLTELAGAEAADLILHGLGRKYGLGPLHLLELTGLPIPNVDISGSLSLGDVIPGTGLPRAMARGDDFDRAFVREGTDIAGAPAGMAMGLLEAVVSNELDAIKRVEKAMPNFLRYPLRAARIVRDEGLTDRTGALTHEVDPSDPQQLAELAALSLGFNPTEYARQSEKSWAVAEHSRFYTTQRQMLIKAYEYAHREGNDELREKAFSEIQKFNARAPDPGLRIGPRTLRQSIQNAAKRRALIEREIGPDRATRELEGELRSLWPETRRQRDEDGRLAPRLEIEESFEMSPQVILDSDRDIGFISARFESGDRGVLAVSSGQGDAGGVSYGRYQLASETGTMRDFLNSPHGEMYRERFRGLQPGTEAFTRRYLEVAEEQGDLFDQAQRDYIISTHFEPLKNKLQRTIGLDIDSRSPVLRELVFSTAVQYGPQSDVIEMALAGRDLERLTDLQILRLVQTYKLNTVDSYFRSSSPAVRDAVRQRIAEEEKALLGL